MNKLSHPTYRISGRSVFASALLLMTFGYCKAEDYTPRDYSIVPPAPQVAALMDYKEYQVDNFRGIPQISFPLYVLRVGQIEVPITLSYHGGGVRVEQKTGNAGLGWNVSCGATISHTIYGSPDDANDRIHGLWHLNTDEAEFRRRLIAKEADYEPNNGDHFKTNGAWQATLGRRYYEGLTDVANDLYSLYGQGLSATFTILPGSKILLSSEQPIKIATNNTVDRITDGGCDGWGFVVTNNEGLTYRFATQDRTKYKYHYGNPELTQIEDSLYYASSWHLNNITDLSGNEVTFSYTPRGTYVFKNTSHPTAYGYSNPDLASISPTHVSGCSTAEYYTKNLTQIVGNGITVSFEYANMPTGNSDALIKTITISAPGGEERKLRFNYRGRYLAEIIDQNEVIYRFSYNADDGDMPHFDREEQDFGGYCNGSYNPTMLIPTITKSCGQIGYGADRSVNPRYAIEASLKRIDYATGGYTEFEWESNTFSHVNDLPFYGKINDTQVTRVVTDTLRACNEEGYAKLNIDGWSLQQGQYAELDLTHYFDMNPANLFGSAYYDSHTSDYYSEINPPHHPHIVIRNHTTRRVVKVFFLDQETIEPDGVKQITKLNLTPGIYDFELKYPGEVQGAEYFMENELRYHEGIAGYAYLRKVITDSDKPRGNENWCGLRIKRIISCAGTDENDVLRKDFFYNQAGDPNATEGTVQMLPKYDYMYYKNLPNQDVPGYESSEVYCVGETPFPQVTTGSLSSIEYPIVLVRMGREDRMEPDSYLNYYSNLSFYSSSRDRYSTDYNFSDFKEYQPIGSRMYTSRAHLRGNLQTKIINRYTTPLITTNYSYNIYENTDTPVLTTEAFTVCDFKSVSGENTYGTYDYGIGKYTLIPYNKTLGYEGVTQADGLDSYKKYDYFYDDFTDALDWNLLKTLTVSDSEYGTSATHYTYVHGVQNYLPYPETEVVLRDGGVVSASRTEYDAITRLPIRRYELSTQISASSLLSANQATTEVQKQSINKLTYEYRYNNHGNLIQISYRGVPLASYIWGYNGQYPIIEASNVDYETLTGAALQSGVTQTQLDGRSITTDTAVSALATQIQNKLPASNITAISYYWLMGVAKITTPRKDSTSFSYDPRGRLIEIRDFNNYLINKYEYHYESATSN